MREWLIYFTCNLFVNLSGRMVNERRDEKATQGITRRRIYFFFYINLSSKTRKKLKTKSIECGSRLLCRFSNSIPTEGELRVETRDDTAVKKTRSEFDIHDKIAWNFREWTFVVRMELKGWNIVFSRGFIWMKCNLTLSAMVFTSISGIEIGEFNNWLKICLIILNFF